MSLYTLKFKDENLQEVQALIEYLSKLNFVEIIKGEDHFFNDFTKPGAPMSQQDFLEMIARIEKQVAQGKTYSSEEVRSMLKKG